MNAHDFINVIIPFDTGCSSAVNSALRNMANPGGGNQPSPALDTRLRNGIRGLHYMSITVVDPLCPAEASVPPAKPPRKDATSHLLLEMSADGGSAEVLAHLVKCMSAELQLLLKAAGVVPPPGPLEDFLGKHLYVIGDTWGSTLGQVFSGSPGMAVGRIRREQELARHVGAVLRRQPAGLTPRERLDRVRNELWDADGGKWKWAFVAEPAPLLGAAPDSSRTITNPQALKAAGTIVHKLFWPLYLPFLAIVLGALVVAWRHHGPAVGLMWGGTVAGVLLLLFVVALMLALLRLRQLERTDPVENLVASLQQARELLAVENFCEQNHLASVSRLKPGLLRRFTLRLAFVIVGTGRFVCAPGFLGKNGVIHFARWMRLPGTDQLLFWSNYDGTWESYVGDFIADAPTGVTAIWSNCVGFPRTRGLVGGGADDRDRLVRWARRQQHPTRFWYTAYPGLTAARVRINAAIRQGLASAESWQDCVDWLSLFGSAPRPPGTLEVPEIPTLVFGGLSHMPLSVALGVALPHNDALACRQFVNALRSHVHQGEAIPGQKSTLVLGFSERGLRRLGLTDADIETFPIAFKQGMPERARMLGDQGQHAPAHWRWGSGQKEVDAFVLVYAADPPSLQSLRHKVLTAAGAPFVFEQEMTPLRPKLRPTLYDAPAPGGQPLPGAAAPDPWSGPGCACGIAPEEPFGFRDGISQPVLRGAPRWNTRQQPNHVVEPGEFVLGYPDNTGVLPPSPSIPARRDPQHLLPDAEADPFRHRPEFSCYEGEGRRDVGANGTFLVVRQLWQDVDALETWLDKQTALLEAHFAATFVPGDERILRAQFVGQPQWRLAPDPRRVKAAKAALKAKMMGRWQDGASLVRQSRPPHVPGDWQRRTRDNDFLLGAEDPTGEACPFGAHVRRANPRDTRFPGAQEEIASTNRHRLLRVGRVYGNLDPVDCTRLDPQGERGLMFMCLNGDIERQFEFVQRSWLLNPSLHGLEDEVDPIIGHAQPGKPRRFTLPTSSGPIQFDDLPDFTIVVGGGYFFLPGSAFLAYLASTHPGTLPAPAPAAQAPAPMLAPTPSWPAPTQAIAPAEAK